jgi:hypothetical protein
MKKDKVVSLALFVMLIFQFWQKCIRYFNEF